MNDDHVPADLFDDVPEQALQPLFLELMATSITEKYKGVYIFSAARALYMILKEKNLLPPGKKYPIFEGWAEHFKPFMNQFVQEAGSNGGN